MALKKNLLTLRITGPDGSTSVSSPELESIILGSGAGAAVKIPDPKVSNLHVMLKVEKGAVTAIDLGSEAGTRVGGVIIRDPVALSSGDVLLLGTSQVEVLFGDRDSSGVTERRAKEAVEEIFSTQKPVQAPAPSVVKPVAAAPVVVTPASAAPVRSKPAPQKAYAGTGGNTAVLFNAPLPAEAMPTDSSKVLQAALVWGDTLINVQHFGADAPVTIGEGKGNAFNVYQSSVGQSFILAKETPSGFVVTVPSDAGVVVSSKDGVQKSRDQLKAEGRFKASDANGGALLELGLHDRVQVSLDTVAFILRMVKPSAAVQAASLQNADFTFFKISTICVMALIAMVAAIVLTPQENTFSSDELRENQAKYVKLLVKPEKKIELKKKLEKSGVEEGAKAKGDEGKFGKQEAKKQEADPSKKGSPVVDANKREEDRKKVMAAGLLGAMGGAAGGASNVFGPGGLGTGINNALGGLKGGAGLGDAQGVGGLGSRGTGTGGGGTGLGLGGLGTKGSGRGAGGSGSLDLGGRGRDSARIVPGKATVVGGLSKDVIMSVIRKHHNEIKFCFEKEAQKTPDLGGKVSVSFTIDPSGSVSEADVSETSLNNTNAESCMLARIRRWRFPGPQGGGVVSGNCPWVFSVAGGADE